MIQTMQRVIPAREWRRFSQFVIIGTVGTLVDLGLLVVFREALGFSVLAANTASFMVGTINRYVVNRLWTYADSRSKSVMKQLVQFTLVCLTGLVLSNAVVLMLATPLGELLGVAQYGYVAARIAATPPVIGWNFMANRLWTFNDVE